MFQGRLACREHAMLETAITVSLVVGFTSVTLICATLVAIAMGKVDV